MEVNAIPFPKPSPRIAANIFSGLRKTSDIEKAVSDVSKKKWNCKNLKCVNILLCEDIISLMSLFLQLIDCYERNKFSVLKWENCINGSF